MTMDGERGADTIRYADMLKFIETSRDNPPADTLPLPLTTDGPLGVMADRGDGTIDGERRADAEANPPRVEVLGSG
jgi:hypothetical protein